MLTYDEFIYAVLPNITGKEIRDVANNVSIDKMEELRKELGPLTYDRDITFWQSLEFEAKLQARVRVKIATEMYKEYASYAGNLECGTGEL